VPLEGEGPVEEERVWGGNEICPVLFVFSEQFDFVFFLKKKNEKEDVACVT
jgi:hypothetical protein